MKISHIWNETALIKLAEGQIFMNSVSRGRLIWLHRATFELKQFKCIYEFYQVCESILLLRSQGILSGCKFKYGRALMNKDLFKLWNNCKCTQSLKQTISNDLKRQETYKNWDICTIKIAKRQQSCPYEWLIYGMLIAV